ncbi:MFS transporter [Paenibacillus sp. ClWae2A]|uniref:MFS transporter n=1 Tax=Paenibacillus sp. ClWae2A TaxID=3057177 RepID=UPI0028F4D4CA|nr:MFS transporter [Paenibacillus sp. ClWae2A]MDT9717878.1 MFS transporter [Paenibacillus sp. ClWae2A]
MLIVFGLFILSTVISIFASSFTVLLITRVIPAFFQPVYMSAAILTVGTLVSKDQVPKAVSKLFMGLTAGMIVGIPISSYISNTLSVDMAMAFFTVINIISFLAILFFVPSMPVTLKISYGKQLRVLKKPILWISVVTVTLILSGIYSVFSFFTEYLSKVTHMSNDSISIMLLLFGVTGIGGNYLAGKWLSSNSAKTALLFPLALGVVYVLIYFMSDLTIPIIILILVWGALFSIGLNISQHWISSSILEAPDISSGLNLSFSNLGITVGSTVGGVFISQIGISSVTWSGVIFMFLAFLIIVLRITVYRR